MAGHFPCSTCRSDASEGQLVALHLLFDEERVESDNAEALTENVWALPDE